MTVQEAIDLLAERAPRGSDWPAWTQARKEADAMVATAEVDGRRALILRRIILTEGAQFPGVMACYVRYSLHHGDYDALHGLAIRLTYIEPAYKAFAQAAKEGANLWPLVHALIKAKRFDVLDLAGRIIAHDPIRTSDEYKRIAEDDARLAATLAVRVALFNRASFARIQHSVIALANSDEVEVRGKALQALGDARIAGFYQQTIVPAAPRQRSLPIGPSRTCETCYALPRKAGVEPEQVSDLTCVHSSQDGNKTRQLLRCDACAAHYVFDSEVEVDVMPSYYYGLARLTKAEMLGQYQALVATSHPRIAEWDQALRNDLNNDDPHWQTEAAWEITRDLRAVRDLDTIEASLLHHPSAAVVTAAMSELCDGDLASAVISKPTLELLFQHESTQIQTLAAQIWTARDATPTFRWRSGPLFKGQASAFRHLLRRGKITATPALGGEALALALFAAEPEFTTLASIAERCAFGSSTDRELLWRACADPLPMVRRRAYSLAAAMPLALKTAALPLLLKAATVDPVACAIEAMAMVEGGAPIASAVPLVTHALTEMDRQNADKLVPGITAAWQRGEDISALMTPLCVHVERERGVFKVMALIDEWAQKHALPAAARAALLILTDDSSGTYQKCAQRALASRAQK